MSRVFDVAVPMLFASPSAPIWPCPGTTRQYLCAEPGRCAHLAPLFAAPIGGGVSCIPAAAQQVDAPPGVPQPQSVPPSAGTGAAGMHDESAWEWS